jgi:hypothetical protein
VVHNRNTQNVIVQVWDATAKEVIYPTITVKDNNTLTLKFKPALTGADSIKVVIFG